MTPKEKTKTDERTPGEKFGDLTKRLLAVPREDIETQMAKHVSKPGGNVPRRVKA